MVDLKMPIVVTNIKLLVIPIYTYSDYKLNCKNQINYVATQLFLK